MLPGAPPRAPAAGSDPDGNRSSDVQIAFRPAFDLPGQHAFNVTVLACALAYAALAPILLVPGAAFFAVRYLVHKHNLLCLHLDNVAGAGDGLFGSHDAAVVKDGPAGSPGVAHGAHGGTRTGRVAKKASDGRLLATVVKIIRVSAFVHAAVMAAFMNLQGHTRAGGVRGHNPLRAAPSTARGDVIRRGGGGGGGGGGGRRRGYYLAGRRAGSDVQLAAGGDGDGGGQFGAGIDAAEARPRSASALPVRRRAPPPRRVDAAR